MRTMCRNVIMSACCLIITMMMYACTQANEASEIYVSVLPQQHIVELIAGDTVTVDHIVPESQNPETYTPLLKTLKNLETAKIFFTIGVPYEKRLLKSLSEKDAPVQMHFMGEYVKYIDMNDEHDTASSDQIDYSQKDPHVWMNTDNLRLLGKSTYETLVTAYPKYKKIFKKNYALFQDKLAVLDTTIAITLNPYRGRALLIDHPSLGYLANEYGLEQIVIQKHHGEEGGKHIREITECAKALHLKTIFVQKGFDISNVQVIASRIDAKLVEINPLQENCFGNLLDIAYALKASFQR